MNYQRKIIYCPNKGEPEVIEKLRKELSKKCDLFIDGRILILTSRVQEAGGQYSTITGGVSHTVKTEISATISPYQSGSMVTVILEKPAISYKYIMLIFLLGFLFVWFIAYVFNMASLPSIPNGEGALQLTVVLGGLFFIAHSRDRMKIEQKIKLVRYLEDALKQ